jgi:hypothetical protein
MLIISQFVRRRQSVSVSAGYMVRRKIGVLAVSQQRDCSDNQLMLARPNRPCFRFSFPSRDWSLSALPTTVNPPLRNWREQKRAESIRRSNIWQRNAPDTPDGYTPRKPMSCRDLSYELPWNVRQLALRRKYDICILKKAGYRASSHTPSGSLVRAN